MKLNLLAESGVFFLRGNCWLYVYVENFTPIENFLWSPVIKKKSDFEMNLWRNIWKTLAKLRKRDPLFDSDQ